MYELPKKMHRKEADLDARVAERVRAVHKHKNWALEVKTAKGKVQSHQAAALRQVEGGAFLYKIPDMGKRNPFDYICLGDADAIVCTIQKNLHDVVCVVNEVSEFRIRI